MQIRSGCIIVVSLLIASLAAGGEPWARHTIDDSSRGADGVRLADINGDGHTDLVTGWEEGGVVRVYLNPGAERAKQKWPAVTVGQTRSIEDAVFVDVDGDGAIDVVSSCEGGNKTMYVHWAPRDPGKLLDPEAWTTEPIPATKGQSRWMFSAPMQVDGRRGVDLVVGSKQPNAMVGWLEAPENPRDLAAWKLHKLYKAGCMMTVQPADMDGDGDHDILISDRKGDTPGVHWLENPGAQAVRQGASWKRRTIGGAGQEVMFLSVVDLDGDGLDDVVCSVRPDRIMAARRLDPSGDKWDVRWLAMPPGDRAGQSKAVHATDVNRDGRLDLLVTCGRANGDRAGVWWIDVDCFAESPKPVYHNISGPDGTKYDLIQLLDLDADGDADLLTCEERFGRGGLGLIWYENPGR